MNEWKMEHAITAGKESEVPGFISHLAVSHCIDKCSFAGVLWGLQEWVNEWIIFDAHENKIKSNYTHSFYPAYYHNSQIVQISWY